MTEDEMLNSTLEEFCMYLNRDFGVRFKPDTYYGYIKEQRSCD